MDAIKNKKPLLSWALYDWANSAFAVTVMAGFFPVFFKEYWSQGIDAAESTFYLGLVNSVASLALLVLSPILGAIADQVQGHKRFLAFFTVLGVLTTALLFVVEQGQWEFAACLYGLALIGFSGSNVFYDALLMVVSNQDWRHRVSALGFALGYLGGGILFTINILMTLFPQVFGFIDAAEAVKWSFISVAIWWAVFSIPLFLYVPETEGDHQSMNASASVFSALLALVQTGRDIRQHKNVWLFLVAYWLYIDGVGTIIRMAVAYGSDMGLASTDLIKALLLTQFVSFPAAILFGFLGERIGARNGIFMAIGVYTLVSIYAYFLTTALGFYLLATCIGLVQGGIQSLSRSLFSQIIPQSKRGEFFGFYNMVGRFSAVLGPLVVGTVGLITGDPRLGILAVLAFFILGAAFLMRVTEPPASSL